MTSGGSTTVFLQGATYPLELLADAERLAKLATTHRASDGRPITTPEERTFARAAVFTAFSFIESLLVELVQQCIAAGGADQAIKEEIEKDLKAGRASISRTIKEWPAKVGKSPIHGRAECREFKSLRQLRNQFTHPKLQPLAECDLTQDELLQKANGDTASRAIAEVKKIAKVMYEAFGATVPPEVQ